jgi:hypothetical protein
MVRFFKALSGILASPRRPARRSFRPVVEGLEERWCPSSIYPYFRWNPNSLTPDPTSWTALGPHNDTNWDGSQDGTNWAREFGNYPGDARNGTCNVVFDSTGTGDCYLNGSAGTTTIGRLQIESLWSHTLYLAVTLGVNTGAADNPGPNYIKAPSNGYVWNSGPAGSLYFYSTNSNITTEFRITDGSMLNASPANNSVYSGSLWIGKNAKVDLVAGSGSTYLGCHLYVGYDNNLNVSGPAEFDGYQTIGDAAHTVVCKLWSNGGVNFQTSTAGAFKAASDTFSVPSGYAAGTFTNYGSFDGQGGGNTTDSFGQNVVNYGSFTVEDNTTVQIIGSSGGYNYVQSGGSTYLNSQGVTRAILALGAAPVYNGTADFKAGMFYLSYYNGTITGGISGNVVMDGTGFVLNNGGMGFHPGILNITGDLTVHHGTWYIECNYTGNVCDQILCHNASINQAAGDDAGLSISTFGNFNTNPFIIVQASGSTYGGFFLVGLDTWSETWNANSLQLKHK